MRVVITGGSGFLGTLVCRSLLSRSDLERVVLFDSRPPLVEDPRVEAVVGDLSSFSLEDADVVFHLAGMVSAECERDPDGAMAINVRGTLQVLGACRSLAVPPRLVFASSVAVFGPGDAGDDVKQRPRSTYGMTKAVGELLVDDFTRKGFVDGRSARLPTVVIRPGAPNAAASGFASGMFREPLAGVDAVVPVDPATRMCLIGTSTAVAGLVALADLDGDRLGDERAVGLPALEVTVAEMIAAVERSGATGRLTVRPDPTIEAVVASWPGRWDATRALALGLPADRSLDEIVNDFRSLLEVPASGR